MKRLLLIFIITFSFQSLIKADDIRDFEIEGISIGESLLDHFSINQIEKYIVPNYYSNLPTEFQQIYGFAEFQRLPNFEVYDNISVDFLMNDEKFIIQTLSGSLFIDKTEDCHTKQKEIDNSLKIIFKDTFRQENSTSHSADNTGNSKTKSINYWFDSDDLITLICTDWSDEITKTLGWTDNLSLEIKFKEYNNFLIEAYK